MRNNAGSVLAVVGGQYGSEGKGVIVAHIAHEFGIHVRVGGPNAGHSFYHGDVLFKMQSLPCGWVNPNALLVIGRGAVVDLQQLSEELELVEKVMPGVKDRTYIDGGAAVLDHRHHDEEGGVHGELHARIGSTGHGVGAARHARMSRDPSRISLARDVANQYGLETFEGTNELIIEEVRHNNNSCLLEGTQGSGLSLVHGPWPYVTSADTNAAQLASDVGLPPRMVNKTLLVVRTFPIRVAGNSGPLVGETTWEAMSAKLGRDVLEQTTVTKKIRRVGAWDPDLFTRSVMLNDPTSIAITFIDYLSSSDAGKTDFNSLTPESKRFIHHVEASCGAPVVFASTGGPRWSVVDRGTAL